MTETTKMPECPLCEGEEQVVANASIHSWGPIDLVPCPMCAMRAEVHALRAKLEAAERTISEDADAFTLKNAYIDALQASVKDLEWALNMANGHIMDLEASASRLAEALEIAKAAMAQLARYREALGKIIDLNSGSLPLPWDTQNIARAALENKS